VQYITRNENGPGYIPYADTGIFSIVFFGGFAAAIFISLFIGTEYSDGTIRNKLVCGYNRSSLYFSKLIVNYSALLIVFAAFYATFLSLGAILLKLYSCTLKDILFGIMLCCLNLLAFVAVFTAISLCKSNKAGVAVFSLVLCMVLLIASSFFASRLAEPEILPSAVYMSDEGVLIEEPEMPNPNYLSGTKRQVYQFAFDFIPMGQAWQISGVSTDPELKTEFAYYSIILAFASTLISIPVFGKKNIN